MAITRRQVLGNFAWRYLERSAAQLVSFVVSIILARVLSPSEFGTVALVNVFINILQVFASSGLGSAVIQKKDADELDFATMFWAQMALCAVVYCILFLCAPLIAKFYNRPEICLMTRVSGISLLIFGIRNIQLSYISKKMMFKKFFFATLAGTIAAAFVGVALAYLGAGTWALIVQHLVNLTIDTVVLWIVSGWKPNFKFAFVRLKALLGFGMRSLISSLIDTVYTNLRQLVISKVYTPNDLAHYNRGQVFPNFVTINISASVNNVLFSAFADMQDDKVRLKSMMRRSLKTESFILSPLLFGLAACSEPIVRVVLTEKWLPCVPFMRIFSMASLFTPMVLINRNAIIAMGRNDITLRLNIIQKVIGIAVLCATIWISPVAVAIGSLACSILFQVLNAYPNKKLLAYSYSEQMGDLLPIFGLAFFMFACVFPFELFSIPAWTKLLIQIPLGALVYLGGAKLFRLEAYEYSKKLIFKGVKAYAAKIRGEK